MNGNLLEDTLGRVILHFFTWNREKFHSMLHQNYIHNVTNRQYFEKKKRRYNQNQEGLEVYLYTFWITMNYKLQIFRKRGEWNARLDKKRLDKKTDERIKKVQTNVE